LQLAEYRKTARGKDDNEENIRDYLGQLVEIGILRRKRERFVLKPGLFKAIKANQ
jgi:hypothetical protein